MRWERDRKWTWRIEELAICETGMRQQYQLGQKWDAIKPGGKRNKTGHKGNICRNVLYAWDNVGQNIEFWVWFRFRVNFYFDDRFLPFPPQRQERNFAPDERHVWKLLKFCHHVVENRSSWTVKVLLERLQPAWICVTVRHENHLQHLRVKKL